jgi:hypothetical protein
MEALTELRVLGLDLARTIHGLGVKAGDLAIAKGAAIHFDKLALGVRRAIALRAWLLERQQQDRDQAEDRRDRRQAEIDHRRRSVAEGVSRAIAAVKPDAGADAPDGDPRERLTSGMWDRLTGDERIDADLADTTLPVEALILGLCRSFGIAAAWIASVQGEAGPAEARARLAPWPESSYGLGRFRRIPAADIGLPEGQVYMLNTDTGAIFNEDGMVVKTLTDQPVPPDSPPPDPGPGNTGPPDATAPPIAPTPAATVPPDPAPPPGPTPRELTLAERAEADRQRRREALELARAENARVAERYRQRMIEADKRS